MTFRARFGTLGLSLLALWSLGALSAAAVGSDRDFRIENKVFLDGEEEPCVQSTTIFHEGVVYDYLVDPAEVTVLDKEHGRFVLLDMTRRAKTELAIDRLVSFADGLRRWSQDQSDPLRKFLGSPQFEEHFDEESGRLSFDSPWLTYDLVTVDVPTEMVSRQYREFSDWYCRLNTFLNPGARPPFARMVVNASLHHRQQFPREVELTIRTKENFLPKRRTVRSEHLLVQQLVESDRKRVAQTDQFMAIYAAVDFKQYQQRLGH
ncbi:MAG: hypothetical protein HQ582_21405 [Planctomycetes bacterium]|nr:hypothetical protein [Planctomycetota bacterium]